MVGSIHYSNDIQRVLVYQFGKFFFLQFYPVPLELLMGVSVVLLWQIILFVLLNSTDGADDSIKVTYQTIKYINWNKSRNLLFILITV